MNKGVHENTRLINVLKNEIDTNRPTTVDIQEGGRGEKAAQRVSATLVFARSVFFFGDVFNLKQTNTH